MGLMTPPHTMAKKPMTSRLSPTKGTMKASPAPITKSPRNRKVAVEGSNLELDNSHRRSTSKAFCLLFAAESLSLSLAPAHQTALSQFIQWLLTSHVGRYHKHYGGSGLARSFQEFSRT